jgi:hypothetical protein
MGESLVAMAFEERAGQRGAGFGSEGECLFE